LESGEGVTRDRDRGRQETKKTLRDDGVMWMFRACALWCATYIVDVAGLIGLFHLPEDSPVLAFVRVAFSLTIAFFSFWRRPI